VQAAIPEVPDQRIAGVVVVPDRWVAVDAISPFQLRLNTVTHDRTPHTQARVQPIDLNQVSRSSQGVLAKVRRKA
jgi:hypothetical protein